MAYLDQAYSGKLASFAPDAPVWVHLRRRETVGQALGYQGITRIWERHLDTSRVHTTRHTFARALEQAGNPFPRSSAD
jgi:hypothetical protein